MATPIQKRFFATHLLTGVLVFALSGFFFLNRVSTSLKEGLYNHVTFTAALASMDVDTAALDDVKMSLDTTIPAYREAAGRIRQLVAAHPGMVHAYLLRRDGESIVFLVDSDTTEKTILTGTPVRNPSGTLLKGFAAPSYDPQISKGKHGAFLSGYYPMGEDGRYLLGVDLDAGSEYRALLGLKIAGGLCLVIAIALAFVMAVWSSRRLNLSIRMLAESSYKALQGRHKPFMEAAADYSFNPLVEALDTMNGIFQERLRNKESELTILKRDMKKLEASAGKYDQELLDLRKQVGEGGNAAPAPQEVLPPRIPMVLVADDEPSICVLLEEILRGIRVDSVTASNGAEALEIFRKDPDAIDVVMLDVTMPKMSGVEAMMEMRKIRKDIPVILFSGFDQDATLAKIGSREIAGFLKKPFTAEQVKELVSKALA